ncbi:hypothetical protein CEP54_003889 [Fusarium duplospermum]|uniref:Uncharacterized protein n=1 Tax=Fusarium duplospermum TaxID=1325734 RepID=A0A428QL98_9HYPO|nr:hypothetical protein CEP54_003889 [Fusarium duplospermum]
MPPQTIQEVLTSQAPAFVLNVNASIPPKLVHTWMMVDPKDVKCWQDFNLSALRNAYGHIFDLPCPTDPAFDEHGHFVIKTLDELKQHGVETLYDLIRCPLQSAIPKLKRSVSWSKNEILCDFKAPATKIDWLWGVFYTMDKTNLVVSCSRLSNTFTSRDLQQKGPDAIYTLRQLATYAAIGQTRYGFILTDQEIVVVRFHQSCRNVEQYVVEWEAIPWEASGRDTLTAPLAVFSLVLMSLDSEQRYIVSDNKCIRLGGLEGYPDMESSS